jgi:hypothetical protein
VVFLFFWRWFFGFRAFSLFLLPCCPFAFSSRSALLRFLLPFLVCLDFFWAFVGDAWRGFFSDRWLFPRAGQAAGSGRVHLSLRRRVGRRSGAVGDETRRATRAVLCGT